MSLIIAGLKSEDDLQVWSKQYLDAARLDLFAFHTPNQGKRSYKLAAWLKKMGMRAGVADWCIITRTGDVWWIELKWGRNGQSDEQIDFMNEVRSRGHRYEIARTPDEFVALCDRMR